MRKDMVWYGMKARGDDSVMRMWIVFRRIYTRRDEIYRVSFEVAPGVIKGTCSC